MASEGGKKTSKRRAQAKAAPKPFTIKHPVPDVALAKIVGKDPIPRTEVTKRVWNYIRENDLQDPSDKRTIVADTKLKPIFGGKDRVSMFELTKLVNLHLRSSTDGDDTTGYDDIII